MVKKWVVKNEYLQGGEKFDDELNSSIEIWKQEINKYPNPERKIIPVDLNRLLAEQRIKRVETAYSFNFFV